VRTWGNLNHRSRKNVPQPKEALRVPTIQIREYPKLVCAKNKPIKMGEGSQGKKTKQTATQAISAQKKVKQKKKTE